MRESGFSIYHLHLSLFQNSYIWNHVEKIEEHRVQVNPMNLVSRLKKAQEELSTLKEQCRKLLSFKQDVMDKAQAVLFENRNLLQQLHDSAGICLTHDSDDPAFANFKQIIDEWTMQVRSRLRDEQHEADSNDINTLLFSAIV